jgi:hypothetical protein
MPVTFNPSDVYGTPILADGNLTVSTSTDGVWMYARTNHGSSTPFYFEFRVKNEAGVSNYWAQVTTLTQAMDTILSSDPNVGIQIAADGYWYSDNVPAYDQFSGSAASNGDRICVAVDPVNSRIWARINNGNWNNSGTANPATNTGGKDITEIVAAGPKLYVVTGARFGPYITQTFDFASTSWSYSAPAGFTEIPEIRRRVIVVG